MMVDTLTIARELKAAELPAGQAEAIAAAIGRAVSETAATKADVENVRIALKADIDTVRHELRTEIERARNQVLIWVVSTQIALGGLIIALLKL